MSEHDLGAFKAELDATGVVVVHGVLKGAELEAARAAVDEVRTPPSKWSSARSSVVRCWTTGPAPSPGRGWRAFARPN